MTVAQPVGNRRPRPRLTPRGVETRDRIVQAAADLVFERGVAGTSVDDVLAASGTSKSQIYHYFADKAALVEAVIGVQRDRVLAAQAPYLDHLDTMAGLRSWCQAIVDLQRAGGCVGGCPVGSLASELSDASEPARRLLQESFAQWQAHLESGLGAMRTRGELVEDADPEVLAAALFAALEGGLLLSQATRSTWHLEAALTMAVDHIGRQTPTSVTQR